MTLQRLVPCGGGVLAWVEDSEIRDWDFRGATCARVALPSDSETLRRMAGAGFLFADRTLGVSVPLPCVEPIGAERVRLVSLPERLNHDEAFDLAKDRFDGDARFWVTPESNRAAAEGLLREYISRFEEALVCRKGSEMAGFLALEPCEGGMFVSLAATDPRYRLAGAALSLYLAAANIACERGSKRLEGRISSRNVAVMSLYASLGAKFSDPVDVFLKEVRPCLTQ